MKKKSLAIVLITILMLACTLCGCDNLLSIIKGDKGDPVTYTVTFKQEGEQDIIKTVNEGENLTDVPTPTQRTGYTVTWDITDFTKISEDKIVNAIATANTYTVTYSAEGFDIDGTTIQLTYDAECTGLDMSLTREDANFIGWKYGNATYTNKSIWNVANNVSVTPDWVEKDQVVVTFIDTNGSSINKTLYVGQTLTDVPSPTPKTGYTVSWDTTDFTNITENKTVNSIATANTYTVTYSAEGFDIDGTTIQLTYDAECTGLDMSLTREDANFIGWKYNEATYTDESIWNVADNVTITPNWVEKEKVIITFIDTNGSSINKTLYVGQTLTDVPSPTPKTGYTVSWDTTDFTNITENKTVNSIATANTYTVTYSAEGFDIDGTTIQLTYDAECTGLDMSLTREDANFIGWKYNEATYTNESIWNVADNVTITPNWVKKDKVIVSFIDTNGSTINITVCVGEELTDVPTPTPKTGYTVSWDVTDFSNIIEDTTVNAVTTAKTYTVTLNANGGQISSTSFTIKYDQEYTLEEPTNDELLFDSWKYNGEKVLLSGIWKIDSESGIIELVAEWGGSSWTPFF